jgi:hypothetical protein
MGTGKANRRDCPDRPLVLPEGVISFFRGLQAATLRSRAARIVILFAKTGAAALTGDRFADSIDVVKVSARLGQQEEVFMTSSWPILDALWFGIWFGPDNFAAKMPAIRLQGEGDPPWDT